MGFSIYNLLKAGVLCANSVAILHPKRFLSKYGLDKIDMSDDNNSLKKQAAGFLAAVGYLKVPLVVCNMILILFELIAG